MTETDWLHCQDAQQMLPFFLECSDPRRRRLFACACCRHVWYLLGDPRSRMLLEMTERHADERATEGELSAAWEDALAAALKLASGEQARATAANAVTYANSDLGQAAHQAALAAAISLASSAADSLPFEDEGEPYWKGCFRAESAAQANLLRCLLGPSAFRFVTADPRWLTPTVVSLARGIYEDRLIDQMPILGDALEDASCADTDILNHCRTPNHHARGCWVVDLILGKS